MAKRISTMELLEQLCREDNERPYYKLVPELNGIEIYFKEKPDDETIDELKDNRWRWHSTKRCWYSKNNADSLALAKKICGTPDKQGTTKKKIDSGSRSSVFSQSNIAPPQIVSFGMLNGNQTAGTFTIEKLNQGYTIHSTNNLIPCCDCYRFFSVHATACPFCGCPISYMADFYFKKGVEETRLQNQKSQQEAYERQRQEEELEKKRQLAELKRKREELLKEREELLRKQAEEEKLRARASEIREICKELSLPESTITELAKNSIDDQTLRARVARISYYKNTYPELKIDASKFITNDKISDYVSRRISLGRGERADCIGNCSLCRREVCVLTSRK